MVDHDELLAPTRRACDHRVAVEQAQGRAPSLVAAVMRGGEPVWTGGRGRIEGPVPCDVQYRIGSITTTFVAVLVMRLRDAGRLDLADRLDAHLPGTPAGDVTIAQLLAHSSGLASETPPPWWERSPGDARPALADLVAPGPRPHPAGERFHYSNTGYALLGALVERLHGGRSWFEVLTEEVLAPLGMERTSYHPVAPHATGWAVHPWADVVTPEPAEDTGLMAPAGQLWSTAADLCRFARLLLGGADRVLAADTVARMRTPVMSADPAAWDRCWGLGVQLSAPVGACSPGTAARCPASSRRCGSSSSRISAPWCWPTPRRDRRSPRPPPTSSGSRRATSARDPSCRPTTGRVPC